MRSNGYITIAVGIPGLAHACVSGVVAQNLQSRSLTLFSYTWIDNSWSSITQTFLVKIIQLVALVALILAIVGATSVSNPTQIETSTEIKAAIVLFLCCYILIVAMTLMAVCAVGSVPDGERILLKAIVLALPFIFVKILYSLMAAFSGLSDFNFVTGSKTIDLCMAVLEEIIVVILYIYAGFRVRAAPPSPEDAAARQPREYGSRRGNFSGGRMGLVSLGVNAANAAADAVQKHSRGQQAGYSSQGSHSDV